VALLLLILEEELVELMIPQQHLFHLNQQILEMEDLENLQDQVVEPQLLEQLVDQE
jgi:hypothetical protein